MAAPASAPAAAPGSRSAVDWSQIDLVVFDVDGTLYDQRRLRLAMLGQLAADAARSRSLRTLRTLKAFRRVREALGEEPGAEFLTLQYSRTAERLGCTPEEVQALAAEWMETTPLPLLARCRYPHLDQLFAALRAHGKRIGVLSDYPALAKLAAMDLQADHVVCATDPDIARLKPDPLGLLMLLRRAGVPPARALMIGDRFDRDGAVARRAGVRALIRVSPLKRVRGSQLQQFGVFRRYDDPVFRPLLAPAPLAAAA